MLAAGCAGLKDLGAAGLGLCDAGNNVACPRFARVAGGGEDDGDRRVGCPFESLRMEISSGTGIQDLSEIGLQTVQNRLRLGVTHADVELKRFRAVAGHHQTSVKKASEGRAFLSHAVDGGPHDGFHNGLG